MPKERYKRQAVQVSRQSIVVSCYSVGSGKAGRGRFFLWVMLSLHLANYCGDRHFTSTEAFVSKGLVLIANENRYG
jgi:hypothetical protein